MPNKHAVTFGDKLPSGSSKVAASVLGSKGMVIHTKITTLCAGQFLGTSSTDCLEIKPDKGQALEKTQSWPAIIVRGHDLQRQICFA